ncbi:ABC transporter ATP-binding protein [Hazenella sp. IB182357]|uniref:ABC transporter ATP-binding protein n=2 Tax=Polycladospora coralii TaxID=2771432 RepID=A0A926RVA4_9BACL|nr:ABC transporter ATP-binding protein [Polycladospora coralii]MBD1373364.1 ABC transporter ATP-binding protein [Polycladospora coralii]MBS7531637.1 ABC transporter ATP-binding protein [Polycladospora coralii]
MANGLHAKDLALSYGDKQIIKDLNISIPEGKITVLVGSNGCGKSTLLRSLARLLKPRSGQVYLNDTNIINHSTRKVATELSILPQGPVAPESLTVLQLVKQGRYPYQSWRKQWSKQDEEIVNWALEVTQMKFFSEHPVQALSGGQRQRAWIAMTLAQDTGIILLDEPTTYLDLTHQIDILDLLYEMNVKQNRTIVMVLHDLNLACRYAHHMVAVHNQNIYAQGKPEDIVTEKMVKDVFRITCKIIPDPIFGTPMCVPFGKGNMVTQQNISI